MVWSFVQAWFSRRIRVGKATQLAAANQPEPAAADPDIGLMLVLRRSAGSESLSFTPPARS